MKRLASTNSEDDQENSFFELVKTMMGNGQSINNDFFLFSDGFLLEQQENQLEELKSRITSRGATIVSHPEAFLKALIHTKLLRTSSTNMEKSLQALLKIGQVKTEEEWKSFLTAHELKLLKSHAPKPTLLELLNPSVFLICTEQEARIGIPTFRIISKLTEGSLNGVIIRPSDLEIYFVNSDELLFNLDKQLKNPVMDFRDYILLAETEEEKQEMARFLLDHGAATVIQNFMDPHLIIEEFGHCAVVVSDSMLHKKEEGNIYFEMKLAGRAQFFLFSELVSAVNEFRYLKPLHMSRLEHLSISSGLIIEARAMTRHMIKEDQNIQHHMVINSVEQLTSLLPNEVLFNALKFLPVEDIINNFSLANKLARKMCFQEHLWKDICIAYASTYQFLSPFKSEEILSRTKMSHYYLFRNVINPIITDYKMVLSHIYSKLGDDANSKTKFDINKFNKVLSTALFLEQTLCQEDSIPIGSTKMHGNLDFPLALHEHPICKRNLILQLNVNELREKGIGVLSLENSPVKHILPESGILYFFDNGIILHYDGNLSELSRLNDAKRKATCAKLGFYEALFIPNSSEILFSDPFYLRHVLLPNCEQFEFETLPLDEVFAQLIHPKFANECPRLFGTFSCFTEGSWYRTGDDDEDRFVNMDSYIEVGSIISPLYQFPLNHELYGYGLAISQEGNRTVWKNVQKMPDFRILDPCYIGNFGREVPSKFKKDFKYLADQFKIKE